MYGLESEIDKIQLPDIALHYGRFKLFGFARNIAETVASGSSSYSFSFAPLLDLDLLELENNSRAVVIMYNYFSFYKGLVSKCSDVTNSLAYRSLRELPVIDRWPTDVSENESSSSYEDSSWASEEEEEE